MQLADLQQVVYVQAHDGHTAGERAWVTPAQARSLIDAGIANPVPTGSGNPAAHRETR